jgi:anti-sigma B factor antagonist
MKRPPSTPVTFKWVHAHIALAEVHGDLVVSVVPQVRKDLLKLARNNLTLLIVDLAQVRRVDSCGVATFVELLRALHARGRQLRLVGLNQQVQEFIHLTSLDHILDIFESVDSALSA